MNNAVFAQHMSVH